MASAEQLPPPPSGPWARFVAAFRARARSRWAWRALLLCAGLAVLAPWLANERPYFVKARDFQGYREALALVPAIGGAVAGEARAVARSEPGAAQRMESEERALRERLLTLERALGSRTNGTARAALTALGERVEALAEAARRGEAARTEALAAELEASLAPSVAALALDPSAPAPIELVPRRAWPLLAALSFADLALLGAWLGLLSARLWTARLARWGLRAQAALLLAFALAPALVLQALPRASDGIDPGSWKVRIAQDAGATAVLAPIPFGPTETRLDQALAAPRARGGDGSEDHWLGTDALGRDLLARILYAGRTSFAVAAFAAGTIVLLGSALGLLAGTLRGLADFLVMRAIELLQAFPTLVLLLGLVAVLPAHLSNSRWSVPIVIAAIGWTHVARLARAEALRVRELGFVRAAEASGFGPARILWRHVLPHSLGPVWVAAAFTLSASLVLESSAAFLGFGVQHPAPSFGGLLADARGGDAWWLALFPGLWLFAAILSIHLVGEGVRDALDPRDAAEAP